MQTLSSTQLPIFFLKNNFAAASTTETEPCQRISDPAKLCRQGLKPHRFWDILEFGAVWRTRTDKDWAPKSLENFGTTACVNARRPCWTIRTVRYRRDIRVERTVAHRLNEGQLSDKNGMKPAVPDTTTLRTFRSYAKPVNWRANHDAACNRRAAWDIKKGSAGESRLANM